MDTFYNPTNVGKRIRDERMKAKIKLSTLSEEMCITEDMLSKIERGLRMCTPDNMFFLCNKFKKSADFFYFGRDTLKCVNTEPQLQDGIYKINEMLCRMEEKDVEKMYQIMKILFADV